MTKSSLHISEDRQKQFSGSDLKAVGFYKWSEAGDKSNSSHLHKTLSTDRFDIQGMRVSVDEE
jgi:hypothetical protein